MTKKITQHEHHLVAVRQKIVMQTALATVKNPEILRSEKTRILMDTGSLRTYITKELADNLQLKTYETQEYSRFIRFIRSETRSQVRLQNHELH